MTQTRHTRYIKKIICLHYIIVHRGVCNWEHHNIVHFDFLRLFSFWLSGFWACRITRTKSWNAFSTLSLCLALASTYFTCIGGNNLRPNTLGKKFHTDFQLLCYFISIHFRHLKWEENTCEPDTIIMVCTNTHHPFRFQVGFVGHKYHWKFWPIQMPINYITIVLVLVNTCLSLSIFGDKT